MERARTGKIKSTELPLTEQEKIIVGIFGPEYAEGNAVPDAMPEEPVSKGRMP